MLLPVLAKGRKTKREGRDVGIVTVLVDGGDGTAKSLILFFIKLFHEKISCLVTCIFFVHSFDNERFANALTFGL